LNLRNVVSRNAIKLRNPAVRF